MPEKLVISNASPIMNLAIIGRLDLLREFFSVVYVTQGVWKETVIDGGNKSGVSEIKNAKWIKVVLSHNEWVNNIPSPLTGEC